MFCEPRNFRCLPRLRPIDFDKQESCERFRAPRVTRRTGVRKWRAWTFLDPITWTPPDSIASCGPDSRERIRLIPQPVLEAIFAGTGNASWPKRFGSKSG